MKVCPYCSFSNDERFPTCVRCKAVLADVPSTPPPNPDDPEHERNALLKERHAMTCRQVYIASTLYALIITSLAAFPGLVFSPQVLLLYFASGIIVAFSVSRDMAGQFSASFLQGIFSLVLVIVFGPLHPFIFFMFVAHIVIPALFWHWTDLIHSMNR